MKTLKNVAFSVLVFLALGLSSALFAQTPVPSAEDEVIALTYKLWNAENQTDMAFINKHISDDYTEFSPGYSTRVDGKTKNLNLFEANFVPGSSLAAEMLNPKVQVFGDVAILSYNYTGAIKNSDGTVTTSKAKSTRVYAKINGTWKLVHANFGMDPATN